MGGLTPSVNAFSLAHRTADGRVPSASYCKFHEAHKDLRRPMGLPEERWRAMHSAHRHAVGMASRVRSRKNMDRLWIGSYVSCQGTHVLEQTVQVVRHRRYIVLRSSPEVASHRRQSIGAVLWHGLYNRGMVFARSLHAQSVRASLLHVHGDAWLAYRLPCLANAAHQRIP